MILLSTFTKEVNDKYIIHRLYIKSLMINKLIINSIMGQCQA